jgi:protoheme IX farnesyltransferase
MFGAISIFLYTSVYTPLKRSHHYPVFVGAFSGYSVYVRLGCCNRRFWDRSWNIILIFLNSLILGGWFLYEDYERQVFMLPTGKKRQGYRFAGYFVYGMAYYSVITAFLRLHW